MATSLESEAERMRRVPGIIFANSVDGRVARIAGTGLEVFEVIISYNAVNRDWIRLKQGYHWLADEQLRAALQYYEFYSDEIDAAIAENEQYTSEYVYSRYPFTRPQSR